MRRDAKHDGPLPPIPTNGNGNRVSGRVGELDRGHGSTVP